MRTSSEIDVKAIRREYARTHTGTANVGTAHGRGHNKVDVTDEEAEFGRALDRYKRENHRLFPTYGEILAVAHAMGYRRVAEPAPRRDTGC